MDDIVARLRKRHANEGWIDDLNVELDAADEIERMQKVHDTLVAKMAKLADERNRWRNVASYFEVAIVNDYLDGGIPPGSVWLLEALEDYKETVSKVSDEVMRIDDDIVTRLRNHAEDEAMLGNDWLRDIMRDGADEIERLRADVDRWKSLCERILDYRLGSTDWQDIRVAYEIALSDYENRKNDGTR